MLHRDLFSNPLPSLAISPSIYMAGVMTLAASQLNLRKPRVSLWSCVSPPLSLFFSFSSSFFSFPHTHSNAQSLRVRRKEWSCFDCRVAAVSPRVSWEFWQEPVVNNPVWGDHGGGEKERNEYYSVQLQNRQKRAVEFKQTKVHQGEMGRKTLQQKKVFTLKHAGHNFTWEAAS